jgi:hypothetical protein
MKPARALLYITAPLLLVVGAIVLYSPILDLLGRWNTRYSSKFSSSKFGQVKVGMPRSAVIELLGAPLQTNILTNYPAWALSDEGVRARYGTNAELQIEDLSFSFSKRLGDFDFVHVWIGPDTNVIQYYRYVTD